MPIANQAFRAAPYAAKMPMALAEHDAGRNMTFEKLAPRVADEAVAFERLHV